MGILHSSSDGEDLEEVEQTSRTRSDPRTNTSMLLENISKTFEHWQEIILNMRENPMPEKDAQKYLYQEMVAARDSLNAIVVCAKRCRENEREKHMQSKKKKNAEISPLEEVTSVFEKFVSYRCWMLDLCFLHLFFFGLHLFFGLNPPESKRERERLLPSGSWFTLDYHPFGNNGCVQMQSRKSLFEKL